jgi:uracil-DNA glycosylase
VKFKMTRDVRERLRRVLSGRLESLQHAGVRDLPKSERAIPSADLPKSPGVWRESAAAASSTGNLSPSGPRSLDEVPPNGGGGQESVLTSPAPTLEILRQEVSGCTRCQELAETRTQTVFGVGNPHARLCFLGEAPGADEDRQGEPFVGRAGQLLNKIIEACRMQRDDVYICNILKCRPPGNRNPLPTEAANCRGYLDQQLELVSPEFICCLGAVAAQNLLGTQQSIGRLRGKVHSYRDAKVVCTYHPAYLLRNPAAKKDTWDDMKLLMREMGIEL